MQVGAEAESEGYSSNRRALWTWWSFLIRSIEDVAALTLRLVDTAPVELREELRSSVALEARLAHNEQSTLLARHPLGPSGRGYVDVAKRWRIEGVSLGLFSLSPSGEGTLAEQIDSALRVWAPLIGREWIPVALCDGDVVCLSQERPGIYLVEHTQGTGRLLCGSFEELVVMAGSIVAARLDDQPLRLDSSRLKLLGADERSLWAELARSGGMDADAIG